MQLPPLTQEEFRERLERAGGRELEPATLRALHIHYGELARWAPKLDLIGPGAVAELFERHYAESLAALPWLPRERFRLVDIGSGAGFPGFVLAAARPDAEVWLVEPRERRAAFLASALRKAGLGAKVLTARVEASTTETLPDRIQVVTLRAVRLETRLVRALVPRLVPGAALLSWSGRELPPVPEPLKLLRTLPFPGSRERFLREYRWEEPAA